MKPGQVFDMNGVPIYPGDLLRTFHYRDRTHRGRKMYLFHVACLVYNQDLGDIMEARPASWLNETSKHDSGNCWLTEDQARHMEIVQGYGPKTGDTFTDRKRRLR